MKWLPGTRPLVILALLSSTGLIALAFASDKGAGSHLTVGGAESAPAYTLPQNLLQVGNVSGDWQKLLAESTVKAPAETQSTADTIGQKVFAGFLSLRNAGLLDDPASQETLIQQALLSADESVSGTQYSVSDLHTVAETSQTLRTYMQNITYILSKTLDVKENELLLFGRAVDTKDANELKKLDASVAVYDGIVKNLRETDVPEGAVPAHLALMNNFSNLSAAVKKMEGYYTDTWGALASVKKIPTIQEKLQGSISSLREYFTARKDLLL